MRKPFFTNPPRHGAHLYQGVVVAEILSEYGWLSIGTNTWKHPHRPIKKSGVSQRVGFI